MTNEELIQELKLLAEKCDDSHEQQAVKSVLCSLLGAMYSHREKALMGHVAEFSRGEVMRLSANRN